MIFLALKGPTGQFESPRIGRDLRLRRVDVGSTGPNEITSFRRPPSKPPSISPFNGPGPLILSVDKATERDQRHEAYKVKSRCNCSAQVLSLPPSFRRRPPGKIHVEGDVPPLASLTGPAPVVITTGTPWRAPDVSFSACAK